MTGQRGEKNGFMSNDRIRDSNKESDGVDGGVYSKVWRCRPKLSPQPVRTRQPSRIRPFFNQSARTSAHPVEISVFNDRHSPALLLGR